MKNKYRKIIKWSKKNKNYLLFFFFVSLGIYSTLYVEYKFQYAQFKWLGWRVLAISAAVVQFGALSKKIRKKLKPTIIKLLFLFIFLYLINFVINSINIYHLDKFEQVNMFCQANTSICDSIAKNFYRFKIYRFVSLTSYFFFYVIFLLVGMLFSEKVYTQTNKIWEKIPKVKLKFAWMFYFLITYLLFQQLVSVFSIMSRKTVKILDTLRVPFQDRWEPAMGGRFSFGWIDSYSKFITSQVKENEIILIPNQTAPWEMEGNKNYIRWFFYPRRTVQMLDSKEIPKEANYALITYGVFGHHKEVFPNFIIEKEKISQIILVDQQTLQTTVIDDLDFNPENFVNKWGVIKLK
jgi:hypothetical protein